MHIGFTIGSAQRSRLGDMVVFVNRHFVADVKFINISSLFIPMAGFILWLELMSNSEQNVGFICVAPHIAKPLVVRRLAFCPLNKARRGEAIL
jgi:hypothetical protein